jgi:glycine oxidase
VNAGFDIAIIGGGVIGLALARELVGASARVVVIDAGEEIPAATNAAAGMLAPSFETGQSSGEALYQFSAASLSLWPEFARALEEEAAMSVDYRDDGILGVALTERQLQDLQDGYDHLQRRRANVEILSGDEARQLEPALSEAVAGALYAPRDAQVDPRKLLLALRAAFLKKGGSYCSDRVTGIEREKNAYALCARNGARFEAEKVVIASGAAALSGLLSGLTNGLPPPPVHPVKGEAVALAMGDLKLHHVVRAPGAYICPKAEARMVIGATEKDNCCDYGVDPSAIAGLVGNGACAVPDIAEMRELERWAGLRPATPDGAPILGGDPQGPDDVFLALGHHRNGILLAPANARALSDVMLERSSQENSALNLKPFTPARFREPV